MTTSPSDDALTCLGEDCRRYTTASRPKCELEIFSRALTTGSLRHKRGLDHIREHRDRIGLGMEGAVACHESGDRCEIVSLDSTAEEGGIGTEPAARPRPRLGKGRLVTKPGPGCMLRVGDPDQGRQRAAKEPRCCCRSTS